jgi:hypothetical protein
MLKVWHTGHKDRTQCYSFSTKDVSIFLPTAKHTKTYTPGIAYRVHMVCQAQLYIFSTDMTVMTIIHKCQCVSHSNNYYCKFSKWNDVLFYVSHLTHRIDPQRHPARKPPTGKTQYKIKMPASKSTQDRRPIPKTQDSPRTHPGLGGSLYPTTSFTVTQPTATNNFK